MTSPDRLLSAIRAALDDTERLALAAGERSRNWRATGTVAVDHDGESPFPIVYDEGYPTEDEAEHIARHDPAAVLRWVEADRRVFARHQPMECGNHSPEHSAQHIVCSYDCDGDWPCPDFRDLADRLGIAISRMDHDR